MLDPDLMTAGPGGITAYVVGDDGALFALPVAQGDG
jgi:hypothetical protein